MTRVRLVNRTTAVEIRFSEHAVERFVERVNPALDLTQARRHLEQVAGAGAVLPESPLWLHTRQKWPHLVIADLCFPLAPDRHDAHVLVATTCLPRMLRAPGRRGRRAARIRRRRFARLVAEAA